jgi:hypothetical protein
MIDEIATQPLVSSLAANEVPLNLSGQVKNAF